MKTGLEGLFIQQGNKRLRYGYTTGTCAAAAAKAAAKMLLAEETIVQVELLTPKGIRLHLEVEDIRLKKDVVSCAIRKDGGDDPDATHGMLIYATVKKVQESRIIIDGGEGVGRVTKKGLEQSIGAAAINRVPREMITENVKEICQEAGYEGGMEVLISLSEGAERAKKTFNPRLGIEGGLSILGTSGIVVPMSEMALISSIRLEMKMKKAAGVQYLLVTPGNYGEAFLVRGTQLNEAESIKCSNYVGETIDMAAELGFKGLLFVAHIGKFIKVAGGIMNTHSRYADSRAEILAANAIRAGVDLETAKDILNTITTEEALEIIESKNLLKETMTEVTGRIQQCLDRRSQGSIQAGAIIFSNQMGELGRTCEVESLMKNYEDKRGEES